MYCWQMSGAGSGDANLCCRRVCEAGSWNRYDVLQRGVTVGALLEIALWLAVPYIAIGGVWAAVHSERLHDLEAEWSKILPVGADLAALGEMIGLWPAVLLLPTTCMLPGS